MARGRKKKKVSRKVSSNAPAIELSELSLSALQKLRARVEERISEVQVEEVQRLRDEFETKAARLGMSVSEIVGKGSPKRRKARRKVVSRRRGSAAKKLFVNPADSSLTWSGRGRRPRWINDYLSGGGTLESIRA